ncbi:hypothetical protein DIPPA_34208 [Diplonema papillatum]|nr:hypothetical protein DIPPA_34208 [Diplonema papillatum]
MMINARGQIRSASDEAARLLERCSELEKSAKERETELERCRGELAKAQDETAERDAEIARLHRDLREKARSLAEETAKAEVLARNLLNGPAYSVNNSAAGPPPPPLGGGNDLDHDPPPPHHHEREQSSGLHRLFSSASRRASAPLPHVLFPGDGKHRAKQPPPGQPLDTEIQPAEVLAQIKERYPQLSTRDMKHLADSVSTEVTHILEDVAGGKGNAFLTTCGAEAQINRLKRDLAAMSANMKAGVNLVEETRQKTESLTRRCQQLEAQVDAKNTLIRQLQQGINHRNEANSASATEAVALQSHLDQALTSRLKLQSMLDDREQQGENFDRFLSDELNSMRDAFSIKLSLAHQEVEIMQKRHHEHLEHLKASAAMDRAALEERLLLLEMQLREARAK